MTAQDYRIFVGIFPTGPLAERIQALRLQHDAKTARITPPHVTLAGTYWRQGAPTPENEADTIARLERVQGQLQRFSVVLGGVASFLPETPVLFLQVELSEGMLAARRVLLAALGADKHGRFVPHMTLTMRLERARTQRLLDDLQRGPHDPAWRTIHELELPA